MSLELRVKLTDFQKRGGEYGSFPILQERKIVFLALLRKNKGGICIRLERFVSASKCVRLCEVGESLVI